MLLGALGAAEGDQTAEEMAWRLRAIDGLQGGLQGGRPADGDDEGASWARLQRRAAYKEHLAARARSFGRDPAAAMHAWRAEAQAEGAGAAEAAGGGAAAVAVGEGETAVAGVAAEGAAGGAGAADAEEEAQAERVAAWLFELPGLSPKQVGSALASPDPFAVRVLSCFMRRFAFSGLRIDEVRMRAQHVGCHLRPRRSDLVDERRGQNGGDLVGCHLALPAPRGCGSSSACCPLRPACCPLTLTW